MNLNNVITIKATGITFYVAYSDAVNAWVTQSQSDKGQRTYSKTHKTLAEAFARVANML